MTPFEYIKLDHYLDGFYFHAQDAARLLSLSTEEREALNDPTQALREYRNAAGHETSSAALAELVCLIAVTYRRGSQRGQPASAVSPLSERNLSLASGWFDEAERRLRAYAHMPASEREWFAGQATAQGVNLPLVPTDQPVHFFAALGELRQRHNPDLALNRRRQVEAYRQLSMEDGHRLASEVIGFWKTAPQLFEHTISGGSFVEDMLLHLACLVPGSLRGLHMDLIRAGKLEPVELFRDVDADAQNELNRIWAAPSVRAIEPTEVSDSHPLYHSECYEFIPADEAPTADIPGPVRVITPHEENCRWCERQLVNLFDIDLRDPRLSFLAPGWNRLRIATCRACVSYSTLLTDVDGEGHSQWSMRNDESGFLDAHTDEEGEWSWPQERLVLGPRRRSPYEAHESILYLEKGASQLGGYPMWVGSEPQAYCPKCQRAMTFIGHLQFWDLWPGEAEGVIYAFLCQDCGVAATTYSQT